MSESFGLSLDDHELLNNLSLLPRGALENIITHVSDGGSMCAAYGWPLGEFDTRAKCGCLAGVGMTRSEYLVLRTDPAFEGEDINWLCQEVFSKFCAQYVEDIDTPLPMEGTNKLVYLINLALSRSNQARA